VILRTEAYKTTSVLVLFGPEPYTLDPRPSIPDPKFGSSTESEREKKSSVLLLFGPEPANDSIPFLKAPRTFRSSDCLSSMSADFESQNLVSGFRVQGSGFRLDGSGLLVGVQAVRQSRIWIQGTGAWGLVKDFSKGSP
jgi:hypothetical protein